MKRTGPTNPVLAGLIRELEIHSRKHGARVWRAVAHELSRPTRQKGYVNVGKINRFASDGETVLVPGKVLGHGKLTKKVVVAAWSFSKTAAKKIEEAGGKAVKLTDLIKDNPKGSDVRIVK